MGKTTMLFLTGLLLTATLAYAGSGDLIVDGNLGVGTTGPRGRIDVGSTLGAGKGIRAGDYLEINEREIVNNAISFGFNASIAADNGTYVPAYAPGTGMVMSMATGGLGDLDFWGRNWGGNSTPVDLAAFTHVMRLSTNGNVGIGTTSAGNKLSIFKAVGTNDYTYTAQHNMQLRITNGLGTYGSKAIEMGILDNGTGVIQANEAGVGYNTLLLNPVTGNVGIGIADPGNYKLYVNGPAYSTGGWQGSDIKFKKNLQPINNSLSKVLKLEGLSYEWKTDEYREKNFQNGRHYGVIAQEIEKVLPEVVNTAPDGSKAVAYTEIIPVLIEAIKEQQKQIIELKKRLDGAGK